MDVATMEMLQAILVSILLIIWLVFSVVFLITAVQNLINDRKREQREVEKNKRDLEYHEARMKESSKEISTRRWPCVASGLYENEVTNNVKYH